jgi:hypothetical protein
VVRFRAPLPTEITLYKQEKSKLITDKNKSESSNHYINGAKSKSLTVENKNRMALDQEVTLVNKYFEK